MIARNINEAKINWQLRYRGSERDWARRCLNINETAPACSFPICIATPSIATPSIATPSIASPSIASPSIASPSIATPSILNVHFEAATLF